jgi:UDP-N-acetylmuramoyl-L-alanyl-D-glutamate--2,6-diaminopimelate ligase
MLVLRELLAGVYGARIVRGDPGRPLREVQDDSRQVQPGDLFVAVPGTKSDGRTFVPEALTRGAAAVVAEGEPGPAEAGREDVLWVAVPSARQALGIMAANLHGAAQELTLSAVTGTNGKTTTSFLLESILTAARRRPGVVGTISYRYPGQEVPAALTTPGPLALHAFFAQMRRAGCTDAVMEITSIALDQARVAGCGFRVAGLTNVTQDHLDYHGTMERYFAAKAILFRELLRAQGVAVLFADREDGCRMRAEVRGRALTVATQPGVAADVTVTRHRLLEDGIQATLRTPTGTVEIASPLVGDFNLANLTLAAGMAVAHGLSAEDIAAGIADRAGVPGRLERVPNGAGVLCAVDYAHTPDALERVMSTLRAITRGRLIVVFGCGGDRDPTKRPIMGEAAARQADLAIITSDNPRTEDPGRIVDMILEGARRASAPELAAADLTSATRGLHLEVDRRLAIRRAVGAARSGDTVLIAGKGHEDYQILGTQKVRFDDREEAAAAFAAAAGSAR